MPEPTPGKKEQVFSVHNLPAFACVTPQDYKSFLELWGKLNEEQQILLQRMWKNKQGCIDFNFDPSLKENGAEPPESFISHSLDKSLADETAFISMFEDSGTERLFRCYGLGCPQVKGSERIRHFLFNPQYPLTIPDSAAIRNSWNSLSSAEKYSWKSIGHK